MVAGKSTTWVTELPPPGIVNVVGFVFQAMWSENRLVDGFHALDQYFLTIPLQTFHYIEHTIIQTNSKNISIFGHNIKIIILLNAIFIRLMWKIQVTLKFAEFLPTYQLKKVGKNLSNFWVIWKNFHINLTKMVFKMFETFLSSSCQMKILLKIGTLAVFRSKSWKAKYCKTLNPFCTMTHPIKILGNFVDF